MRGLVSLATLLLCAAFILASTSDAGAQCSARDVLQRQLSLKATPAVPRLQGPVVSASDVAGWRAIIIGTFPDAFALSGALSAIGCGIGDTAAAALATPAFTVSDTRRVMELVTVSAADMGFKNETVSLRQIHDFAQQLGFGLAPPEIALQLRLQYLDQPVGEFLIVGMKPIRTWTGEEIVLTVANGGAGLILIGQDGRYDAEIPVTSRFVFVRPAPGAPAALAEANFPD
ncbi:hypothetical protein [Bradyrhizobium guangzhouense]|uniref:Uncharacterized protein n=1 Tax=Bradyrhizobium guangzhouense TaxID=1325095 RepID=A0AAE5X6W1_9BRAD|nr:hypothetical protein [Bradyrhizobium guangzhouense]QAU49694.1 hypothetical protein XH91_32895 [Bradyrhizobium guangzhouense]RXH17781.1 hypothetical protein EAS56_01460 [Bradyrhizobium guangzhouense]RXH20595.1 hypothetical protein EAS54_01185 [Bradyrhizobium guangzhouense]